jgi:hypothetical protein
MAKAAPGILFTGTIGDICFYQWGDRTIARKKSSLTRDRVLKSKEFAPTRKFAGDMGRASRMASEIYKALPRDIKGRWIFRAIAGDAASLLYKGKNEQDAKDILWRKYVLGIYDNKKTLNKGLSNKSKEKTSCLNPALSSKQVNRQFRDIFLKLWEKQGKPPFFFNRAWKWKESFNPDTIPRRSEYFLGLEHAVRWEQTSK